MKLYFKINYETKIGEHLVLQVLKDEKYGQSYDLHCQAHFIWEGEVDYFFKDICYRYQVLNIDKQVVEEEIVSHFLLLDPIFDSYQIQDTWSRKNFPENYLNNKIFKNKKRAFVPENVKLRKIHTHLFRIEAPLYNPNWKIILIGDISELGLWQYDQAIALQEVDFGVWEVALTISASYNFEYKYGIYDNESKQVIFIEGGDTRISTPNLSAEMLHFKK